MTVYDGLLGKLGDKVGRMRPMPTIQNWQNTLVPGESRHGIVVSTRTEDPAWSKVDALIVKALDGLKKRGVERPLTELQEASFQVALRVDDLGMQLFAWRLLNTRHFVEEWSRLRGLDGENRKARDTDVLFYGDGSPAEQAARVAEALRARGILKKAKRE